MKVSFALAPMKCALLFALISVSTANEASAAKAVPSQGPQLTQGWITGVHRANGQLTFRIRTAGGGHRIGVAANQNGGTSAGQNSRSFIAGPNTRFESTQGTNVMPASFATLRSGQRVMIESQGSQATRVRIFARNAYAGRGRRVHGVRNASGSHHAHHQGVTGQTARNVSSTANVQRPKSGSAAHHVGHKSPGGGHGKSHKR
jgi:hypothetical protein